MQTCNPPDFKFYPSKLTNENSPTWSNVKLSFFIVKCIVKCNKSEHKINSFIIYLANLVSYIFVKFTKTKMGYASGFRAMDSLPRQVKSSNS